MTGLTTHKADWKGNFLVVDQQTLNDLGGKADELLAASGDREAFAQSMREAVYRAHAEALQNYKTDGAKLYRMNQGVMFRHGWASFSCALHSDFVTPPRQLSAIVNGNSSKKQREPFAALPNLPKREHVSYVISFRGK